MCLTGGAQVCHGAQHAIQQQVSVFPINGRVDRDMVIQHEMAFEPGFGRRRRCLADMIRLKAALRNETVALAASAAPIRNSALRVLLPPRARPVQSSRLM